MYKKISLTVSVAILTVVSILTVNAERKCNAAGFCVPLGEYTGEPRVYFIGNRHTDESLRFEHDIQREAIKKKIVMGAEALSREELEEKRMAATLSGKNDNGYMYGLEDLTANILTDVTNSIRFINLCSKGSCDAGQLLESKNAVGELLLYIKLKSTHTELWKKFRAHVNKHHKSLEKLNSYRLMDATYLLALADDLTDQAFAIHCTNISNQVDMREIKDIFVKLGIFICDEYIAKLPLTDQPNLQKYAKNGETNVEILKKALNNLNTDISTIITRFDLTIFWRNSYWKKHFHFLYNQAKLLKKDLVIIAGMDHYADMLEFLKKQDIKLFTHKVKHKDDTDLVNDYINQLLKQDGDIFAL